MASAEREHAHQHTADRAPSPALRPPSTLVVGAADDRAEIEADRVADAVIQRLQGSEQAASTDSGEHHVHNGCHGVARSASAVSGSPEVGRAGGELSSELSARIEGARTGGRPLEDPVRRRLEPAFGGSLADVRVHTDSESASLNRAVSARAFTPGRNIFFGAGEYAPDTEAGERVLAHEIAHTRQGGGAAKRIHRYALANPDFSQTETVKVFQGGGSGNVALFDDGSGNPLVVKVDQLIGHSVAVAGALHGSTASANGGSGGFSVTTPGVRMAEAGERIQIKQQTLAKMDPTDSPRNFVKGLDSTEPVILMEKGAGVDFSKAVEGTQHVKKGFFGAKKANDDSILFQLVKKPGPLTTLGQQLPVDVLMGMFDRLIGYYNPDNFMYDKETQSFGFVDNTQNGNPGFLVKVALGGGQFHTAKESFDAWARHHHVQNLINTPPALAQSMFQTTIENGLQTQLPNQPGLQKLFNKAVAKNKTKMLTWIEAGIVRGRTTLAALANNPLPLVAGLPAENRLEALQSVLARLLMLGGSPAAQAWQDAGAQAQALLPPPKVRPPVPPKPARRPQPQGGGNRRVPPPVPPKPGRPLTPVNG